eukprot:EW705742.1.p2 GENE.EW705742.1~~EW705742.1.p2  ORF type:complete len:105 (+),score=35.29 EW705742.1:38-316(+)
MGKTWVLPNDKRIDGCFTTRTTTRHPDDPDQPATDMETTTSLAYPGYTVSSSTSTRSRVMVQDIADRVQDFGVWSTEQVDAWKKTLATVAKM